MGRFCFACVNRLSVRFSRILFYMPTDLESVNQISNHAQKGLSHRIHTHTHTHDHRLGLPQHWCQEERQTLRRDILGQDTNSSSHKDHEELGKK
jgi:hypothetical protein